MSTPFVQHAFSRLDSSSLMMKNVKSLTAILSIQIELKTQHNTKDFVKKGQKKYKMVK